MDIIAKNLSQAVIADKVQLIRVIADDYNLDVKELIEKYIEGDQAYARSLLSGGGKKQYKKKKNDYVEAEEFTYHGVVYLVDGRNQVYTNNLEKPMMIGERLVDGSVKFFDGYNPLFDVVGGGGGSGDGGDSRDDDSNSE